MGVAPSRSPLSAVAATIVDRTTRANRMARLITGVSRARSATSRRRGGGDSGTTCGSTSAERSTRSCRLRRRGAATSPVADEGNGNEAAGDRGGEPQPRQRPRALRLAGFERRPRIPTIFGCRSRSRKTFVSPGSTCATWKRCEAGSAALTVSSAIEPLARIMREHA